MDISRRTAAEQATELLGAVLALTADLDMHSLLERFVAASADLTGARFGAINIVDELGASATFVQTGFAPGVVAALAHPPHARGVLGQIPDHGVLRLDDLTQHPAFRGLPSGHPPMGSFLGAAVRVRDETYGYLYLAEKDGGFDPADAAVVTALAAAAAVAVQNAQLYAIERRREQWLTASQHITTMLLEGADQEDVLVQIAATARQVDGADTAALVLPGLGGALVVEIVDGPSGDLLGLEMTGDLRVMTAFSSGVGQVVVSLATSPGTLEALSRFGPALYAPLSTDGHGVGVLVLLRRIGAPAFTGSDLVLSQSFASQAAVAFVLAEARHAQGRAALHDERTRIARDLHDLAIQQLFAAGLQLQSARHRIGGRGDDELPDLIDGALVNVDATVRQIRLIVRALDDTGVAIPLVERVHAEVELARSSLGFSPSVRFELDGAEVATAEDGHGVVLGIDDVLALGRANNVVAVVREGLANVARHARSRSVSVRVSVQGDGRGGTITVEVEDDGVGVPRAPDRRSGTRNLAVRAEQSGGTFTLGSPPSGRGALLRWHAPLD